MGRTFWLRLATLGLLTAASGVALWPSYLAFFAPAPTEAGSKLSESEALCRRLPALVPCRRLNLGLDLQGGVHLVMGVRVDRAWAHRLDRVKDALADRLAEAGVAGARLERAVAEGGDGVLTVTLAPTAGEAAERAGQTASVERLLRADFPHLAVVGRGPGLWRLDLSEAERAQVRQGALEQAIKTIRNRADRLGVTEPTIARRGDDQILIQLPGVRDPDRAIDIIGRTAQLEFTMVDAAAEAALAEATAALPLPGGAGWRRPAGGRGPAWLELPEAEAPAVRAALASHLGRDHQLAFGPAVGPDGREVLHRLRAYVLAARPGITGDFLTHAQAQAGGKSGNDFVVSMGFDPEGAKIFARLTESHVGEAMAIVLDGTVVSAPAISEKIAGGQAQITLGRRGAAERRLQEAKDLALVLKAGALPAPVEVLEKRQVGKTLGQDTVARGAWAMGVGTLAVVIFMAAYYRLSGMMANLALALNVLMMLAVLALCDATLTLPGMAGMVLTIGMAVDANVLIFERIREELRAGRGGRAAVEAGYKKAFGTIFDANVTTLIAGVVLWHYGSGPVRGFAVTLIVGLTCSLYTAIVVTRLLYDLLLHRRPAAVVSI